MPTRSELQGLIDGMSPFAFYPPVRVVELGDSTWLECAGGHHWSQVISDKAECRTCRTNHEYRAKGRPECEHDGCHNVVTCSDRAFEGGVRTCEMHWREEAASDWTAGPVCIDDGFEFMAQYPRLRWNGWVMPSFDAWSVQQMIESLAVDQSDYYRFTWRDDLALEVTQLDGDEEFVEVLEPDTDGLYALGAGSWTWSEDENFYRTDEWKEWDRQRVRVWIDASNAENHRQIAEGVTDRMGSNEAAGARAVAEWRILHPEPLS